MSRVGSGVAIGRRVVEEAQEDEITFLAASIAYYAFISLIPLLLFLFLVVSIFGGQELANQVVDQSSTYLAPAGQEAIRGAITGEEGRAGATVAGFVVLLWSALKLFRGLDIAFSIVYGSGLEKSILGQFVNALLVFGAILIAVLGMLALGTLTVLIPDLPFISLTPLLVLIALSVVFLPVHYVLPDVDGLTVRQALPGAVLTGAGWSILQSLFGIYASNAGQYDAYGVVGAILLLLTWLYIGGIVIILGAVLNYVLMVRDNDAPDGEVEASERTPLESDDAASAVTSDATDETDRGIGKGEETTDSPRGSSPDIGGESGEATDSTRTAHDEAGTGKRGPAPDVVGLQDELRSLRTDLDDFQSDVEDRTMNREEVESDLKSYVRKRMRRGHARGWGPYLVLLYGTAMTLGAFYFLAGGWAIAAMLVLWLSTLGLYVLMVMVGAGFGVLGVPGRVRDAILTWRGE
ncbi:YihY/virulence factor BrkB family protein [Halalkalicoccus ordinarius]|uniref:YihY/virulence factor BrkB family protein n=1 Tax=Halalkalicoccus ordinarius TaxID=3116651 RepID=UPI00300F2151